MKLRPIPEDEPPFVEKLLRQPTEPTPPPEVTDKDAVEQAHEWARLKAEVVEREERMKAIRDALAERHLGEVTEGSVRIGPMLVTKYYRRGEVQWSKLAPKYLPADVNPDDYRKSGSDVIKAEWAK